MRCEHGIMNLGISTQTPNLQSLVIILGLISIAGAAGCDAAPVAKEEQTAQGNLRVDSRVQSGIENLGEVIIYVFSQDSHDEVVTAMRAGERVALSEGIYDLRVVLMVQSEEQGVQWLREVVVSRGVSTERQVSFRRGALLVRARNSGQQLPSEAVTISVYHAGDVQEEVIGVGLAEEPLDLVPGQYDDKATLSQSHDKPTRWLRGLDLEAGTVAHHSVEITSGTVTVDAAFTDGEPVGPYDVYVYFYRAEDHAQPVAYTPAGESAVLEGGTYDVRANFFRSHDQPDIWLRNLVVQAGQTATHLVTFPSAELLIRAYDSAGTELIGDNVLVSVYASDQRKRPIASAPGGEAFILTEDIYDVRVVDTRRPEAVIWLPSIRLRAGQPAVRSVSFRRAKPGM